MDHSAGEDPDPSEDARRVASDPALPDWAVEARDQLLDGNALALEALERLHTAAPWLYDKGRDWLRAR